VVKAGGTAYWVGTLVKLKSGDEAWTAVEATTGALVETEISQQVGVATTSDPAITDHDFPTLIGLCGLTAGVVNGRPISNAAFIPNYDFPLLDKRNDPSKRININSRHVAAKNYNSAVFTASTAVEVRHLTSVRPVLATSVPAVEFALDRLFSKQFAT
jgi:hypothetical protein